MSNKPIFEKSVDESILEKLSDSALETCKGANHVMCFELVKQSELDIILEILSKQYNPIHKHWVDKPKIDSCFSESEAEIFLEKNMTWILKKKKNGFFPFIFMLVWKDGICQFAQASFSHSHGINLKFQIRNSSYTLGSKGWDPKWISIYFFLKKP